MYISFPWRVCFAARNNKLHFTPLTAPLLHAGSLEPTSYNKRLRSFLPTRHTCISQRKGTRQDALIELLHSDYERSHPNPNSFQAERSVSWAGISHTQQGNGVIKTGGTRAHKGDSGGKIFLQKQVYSRPQTRWWSEHRHASV